MLNNPSSISPNTPLSIDKVECYTQEQLDYSLGSFKSFIHNIYIKKQTTTQLVESFIAKKPKYREIILENIPEFFKSANLAIKRKIRSQV